MNERQVREIAEAAFKARFADIPIVSIDVKPGFDHYDDPLLDVRIVYDGKVEQLIDQGRSMEARSEIIEKVWEEAEDSPGWPQVHFIAKSDLEQPAPAAA